MVRQRVERKLAAVLVADVAGYSRLMELDEEETHRRLSVLQRELIRAQIGQYHGKIIKSTGDGVLVEFASVVDAVRCAVEIQCRMSERNADVPDARRIEFRIGVNLGDVIVISTAAASPSLLSKRRPPRIALLSFSVLRYRTPSEVGFELRWQPRPARTRRQARPSQVQANSI